ncbi:hypothetical protein HHUSO_G26071 [Huso huso]|uniref:Uncharacterized protein n=1 Tax=Huso huso TaxID=61971 RepID=A0ABR0YNE4_HUSHU
MLLGSDLTRCSSRLVGNTWHESQSQGCKVCRCVMIQRDVFQECETPMRPSAWPMGCERVRAGCNYTIVRTDKPEIQCPGWSYTSYKYLIRVTGFAWDPKVGDTRKSAFKQNDVEKHLISNARAQEEILNAGSTVDLSIIQNRQKNRREQKRNGHARHRKIHS